MTLIWTQESQLLCVTKEIQSNRLNHLWVSDRHDKVRA